MPYIMHIGRPLARHLIPGTPSLEGQLAQRAACREVHPANVQEHSAHSLEGYLAHSQDIAATLAARPRYAKKK